ncbi:MAG: Spi family protease inhibitor [Prevotella sp.]|nr:Spi family protease inhibitor [Prevotella sp.]MCM1075230.1 Spi family protease inhibitor [Ruminococcus sp.]
MGKYFAILLMIFSAFGMSAETVSQKQAKNIAQQFFNAVYGQVMGEPKLVYNGRRLTTKSLFPPFYIYNLQAGGFVVVSAENKAFPILGYNLKDNFDTEHISDTLKELLRLYALHIEAIRYDSSIPYEAERAWTDLPDYISGMLAAPYIATDPRTTKEEAVAELNVILEMTDPYSFASSSYTPDQWQYSIDTELEQKPDVVLGLIKGEKLLPIIVYGHKGDYYRMDLDGRNNSLWRLLPTEILSKGQVASLGNPTAVPEPEVVEEPHTFYEAFIEEQKNERARELAALENTLVITEPKVQWIGGGHFTVSLPEEVSEMRLYTLDGAQVQYEKFRDTPIASVNLSGRPSGFYFAVFMGKSGTPYSVKVFR